MTESWQGLVHPPYRAGAIPLIHPLTDQPTGRFRAMVTGGERTLWDGSRAPSSATGPACADERAAIAEAERQIASFTDGLLDFDGVPDG